MASRTQYKLEVLLGAKKAANFESSINSVKQSVDSISATAKKAAGLITAAFAAVNIKDAVVDAVNVYSDFEQRLASSAAIAGASETEYKKMEKASRDAGKATIKTAEESAAALGYMALAGWSVEEQTQGLMPVLKLSAATNLDLAQTSDLVTDSMSAMNLQVKDMTWYLDMVTQANNASNTTAEQLMQAFIKTGGAARTLNIDTKETATALGILANNGTKAEEGGRAMNAMLTRMASNKNALEMMDALNISVFDAEGNFVGLEEALKRINKGVSGLTVEGRSKALKDIAGTNYYSKMKYLLDGVKEGADGAESAWDALEKRLGNSEGTLEMMYETMTDTLSGAKEEMESAIDDTKISFADAFDGELVDVYQSIGDVFNKISEGIADFADENEVELRLFYDDAKDFLVRTGESFSELAGSVVGDSAKIEGALAGLVSGFAAHKFTSGVNNSLTALFGTLGLKEKALLTAVDVGVTALFAGTAAITQYTVATKKKLVEAGLEEHFGNISLSLEDLDDIAQDIVGKKSLTQIAGMLDAIGRSDEALENMRDSFSTVSNISWKLRAGFQIDKDDREAYASAAEDAVKYAQEVVEQEGYSVSVATKLLLGDNSQIGMENDAFYRGLDIRLDRLQKKLQKKLQKAVENGVDINTDKSIQKLLSKVNQITSAITDAENEAELQSIDLKYSGKDLTASNMKMLSKDIEEYVGKVSEGAEEAYKTDMATLNARYNMGDLSKKEYMAESKTIKEGYFKTKSSAMTKGADYIFESVLGAYGISDEEFAGYSSNFQKVLKKRLKKQLKEGFRTEDTEEVINDALDEAQKSIKIPESARKQMSEMFTYGLDGIFEDMQAFMKEQKKAGFEPDAEMQKKIADIGTLADDSVTLEKVLNEDDTLSVAYNAGEKAGYELSDGLSDGITETSGSVRQAVDRLVDFAESYIDGRMSFTINMDTVMLAKNTASSSAVIPEVSTSQRRKKQVLTKKKSSSEKLSELIEKSSPTIKSGGLLYKNAKGGIYKKPILSTFAEEGPEAAIPLDGSGRAKAIWQNAGRLLGMRPTEDTTLYNTLSEKSRDKELAQGLSARQSSDTHSASGAVINYAPVINVQGNADEKVITRVVKMSQREFGEMLQKYQLSKKRVAFE